ADVLGAEPLQTLCDAWREATSEMTPGSSPLLTLACRVGGAELNLPSSVEVPLVDPDPEEAVRMVAELLGGDDPAVLGRLVLAVGPVPAFLQGAATALLRDPTLSHTEAL